MSIPPSRNGDNAGRLPMHASPFTYPPPHPDPHARGPPGQTSTPNLAPSLARQPSFDPFLRREGGDPFFPAANRARGDWQAAEDARGSSAAPALSPSRRPDQPARLAAQHAQPQLHHATAVLQPQQSGTPLSPYHPVPSLPVMQDSHGRRRSIGSAFAGGSNDPLPPPPPPPPSSLYNRNMPPPSTSPQRSPASPNSFSYPRPATAPVPPAPGPPAYTAGRDFPTPKVTARTSSSMSIKSLMSPDTNAPPATSQWPSFGAHTAASPTRTAQSPTRPAPAAASMSELDSSRRPRTPEERRGGSRYNYNEGVGLPYSSPAAGQSQPPRSPDQARPGISRLLQSYQGPSPGDSAMPPRPFSQPAGPYSRSPFENPSRDNDVTRFTAPSSSSPNFLQNHREDAPERTGRDRSHSNLESSKTAFLINSPSRNGHESKLPSTTNTGSQSTDVAPRRYGPWTPAVQNQNVPSRDSTISNTSNAFRDFAASSSLQNSPFPPRPQYTSNNPSQPEFQLDVRPSSEHADQYNSSALPRKDRASEYPDSSFSTPAKSTYSNTNSFEPVPQRSFDDPQQPQRSFSGLGYEAARRIERGSPLPQAVKGAQAQLVGYGGDSGVKSEFGRMFSGLGSGVGSITQPSMPASNGSKTPLNESPTRTEDVEFPGDGPRNAEGWITQPAGSWSDKRGRAFRDDEIRRSNSADGRSTPANSNAKSTKRSKHTHTNFHHHHHTHVHHPSHHHHHHKPEDDLSAIPPAQPPAVTPFNTIKFNGSSQNSAHHHHHRPPHHHHHPPKQAAPPIAPPPVERKPVVTIKTAPLLQSVSHLPRRHLGSQLYSATVGLPPTSMPLLAKYNYTSTPTPLPRFDDKENCTFTVRVPRFYLTKSHLEQICLARNVWGTEVYTDDSDPIGAAVHAGFIRGEYGDAVPQTALETLLHPKSNPTAQETLSAPTPNATLSTTTTQPHDALTTSQSAATPPSPVSPPANHVAHITLLILPPLEKYYAKVSNGLRSRRWGATHDGMSFMVLGVTWVEATAEQGRLGGGGERGGAARRRRMREWERERRAVRDGKRAKRARKAVDASARHGGVSVAEVGDGQGA